MVEDGPDGRARDGWMGKGGVWPSTGAVGLEPGPTKPNIASTRPTSRMRPDTVCMVARA